MASTAILEAASFSSTVVCTARGLDGYTGYQSAIIMILQSTRRYSSTGAARINPGHGTKIARGLVWYKSDQHESMLIKFTC